MIPDSADRAAATSPPHADRPAPGGHRDPDKRERIIEAASGLFGGRDLASVRMEEVAARAGVAKGTIYLYFRSKEDLYLSILSSRLTVLLDALDAAFQEEEDPRIRLRKFLVHSSMFLLKYPDFFRMMRKEDSREEGTLPGSEAEVGPLRARLRDLLRCLLTRGMEAGRIRPLPVELTADLVFGAMEGVVRRCLDSGPAPPRPDQAPAFLFDLVWRALRTDDSPASSAAGAARLDGAVVAITREEEPGEGLAAEIARLGGRPLSIPVLRTEPPADLAPLRAAIHNAGSFAWILFTSARGVDSFAAVWREADRPALPAATQIGVVGPATAERARKLLGRCDCAAAESSAAGLAGEILRRAPVRGARILLAGAEEARPELAELLRNAGGLVEPVVAYRTVPAVVDAEAIRASLRDGAIAAVTFASPSAVQAFITQIGATWLAGPDGHAPIVTIGSTTSAAVRACGLETAAEAEAPSLRALAQAALRVVHIQQGVHP